LGLDFLSVKGYSIRYKKEAACARIHWDRALKHTLKWVRKAQNQLISAFSNNNASLGGARITIRQFALNLLNAGKAGLQICW
jgi:hypothetical protein